MSALDRRRLGETYPFASNYLELPAGRLHYLDEGPRDAPVLLCLHGNPTWSFYYRDVVRRFSRTHRVVALDHLGCGLSDKPQLWSYTLAAHVENVIALVEALRLDAINLMVHDWGGAIGMGFAVARPERVARLVVLNTGAFPSARMPGLIGLARLPGFGKLMIRGLNAFGRGALLTCIKHRERLTPEVRAGYLGPYSSWSSRVAHLRFVEDIPMSPRHPSWGTLTAIADGLATLRDRPMLLLWGGQDFVFDDAFFAEWRARFPAAEVEYYPDAGHYVLEDAGERILPRLAAFLGASEEVPS